MADIRTLKQAQIKQLERAANVQESSSRMAGVTKEAALLDVYVVEEANDMIQSSAEFLGNALDSNGRRTSEAAKLLADRVDALSADIREFTRQAEAGTTRLANWTIVLAIATVLLFVATAALVATTFFAEPPQAQIVVVPSPPK